MRTIQDPMIILEMLIVAQAHHVQAGRDGSFAYRQDGTDQQRLCVFPNRLGKQGLKLYDKRQQFGRQCGPQEDFRGKEIFRSIRGLPFLFQRSKWIKSS
jgi:hypothetical protein